VFPGNLQGRHIGETGPRGCQLVGVNDSLEITGAEHRPLDVVRWERVNLDVSDCESVDGVLTRVGDGLGDALSRVDGRLLAARITLTGASVLHGHLKRDLPWLRAECIAQGQIAGGDGVWVEEVVVATSPLYDLGELAARDDLTRIVLETLEAAGAGDLDLPEDAAELLRALPPEIRCDLETDLAHGGRAALLEDVRAILLEALAQKGGES
jgi:hypothetical protein